MMVLHTLLSYFLAFGILVVFHELGHYSVARLCGVKVLRFSIGIGRILYSRRLGVDQTEWAISLLPLGGYVQMLDARDQDMAGLSEAELKREFTRQSVWRRMAIVAAGPLANFLLAIVVYCGLNIHGVPEPAARMGYVALHTAAYDAGLRGGETITAINGSPVHVWSDLQWGVTQAVLDKAPVQLDFDRSTAGVATRGSVSVPTDAVSVRDLDHNFMATLGLGAPASKAMLGEAVKDGPAMRSGLREGDLVVAVDDKPIADQVELRNAIRAGANKTLQLTVLRDGVQRQFSVIPDVVNENGTQVGQIKVNLPFRPDMIVYGQAPLPSLVKATRQTWQMSAMEVRMIGKMIIGQASWKNISGPVTIAEYAGETARAGLTYYLSFIAFISVSLGVMNLLPIPVLDGGLLLYYSLEVLTGRPVSARFGEIAQRAGIGILMLLMLVAVFNDIARHLT
ncbi:MAG TPA: RIP metalloprotease RseP [Burkholderiaceae bacterium]